MEIPRNAPPMNRILMTADTLGGVWTYSLELANALANWNIEIFLATMGRKLSEHQWAAANKIENLHIIESDFKVEWMNDPWQDVEEAGKWLLDLEQQVQPHLIHLNNYAHGDLPWNAPVLMTAHSDVFSWHAYVKNKRPDRNWFTYHKWVENGLKAADHVVAITKSVEKDLKAQYYYATPTSVIHNGLSSEGFAKSNKENFVLSVGRIWDEAKNFRTLNEAARFCSVPIAVAGENRHPETGNKTEFEHLYFTGNLERDKLSHYMGRAAVYCLPAAYEPFGYTPLEAALCGCALVLSDLESLNEIWQEAAIYFNPEDPLELADQLKRVIADKSLRSQLATRAMKRAKTLSATNMAANYMKLYQKLVNHDYATKLMTAYAN